MATDESGKARQDEMSQEIVVMSHSLTACNVAARFHAAFRRKFHAKRGSACLALLLPLLLLLLFGRVAWHFGRLSLA